MKATKKVTKKPKAKVSKRTEKKVEWAINWTARTYVVAKNEEEAEEIAAQMGGHELRNALTDIEIESVEKYN
jgi:hypothetical protein